METYKLRWKRGLKSIILASILNQKDKSVETDIGASQVVQVVRNPPANAGEAGDVSLIPGSGRFPGGGNGNSVQYFCLEKSMGRGSPGGYTGSQRIRCN